MSNNPFNQSTYPRVQLDPSQDDTRTLVPPTQQGFSSSHESPERMLSPNVIRSGQPLYRDHSPSPYSPTQTTYSSRRSSWESRRSRDSQGIENPFRGLDDSRPGSRAGSDDDVNTQTVAEKYNILPSAGLLLYPEDVENDDYLHNPDPGGEPRDCDIFTRRGFINVGGLALITIGILMLFIGYPAITFVRRLVIQPDPCKTHSGCIPGVGKVPLMQNIRFSLVDPDTPQNLRKKKDYLGNEWTLTYSDEFSKPGRTFYAGDDPYMTAVDIWYGVTGDLEWYDPDSATTNNGVLELRFDAIQNHNLNYRSAMLQSWNQLCFRGGRLEASISLPGRGDTVGFWPGFWTLGNLGRAGYAGTTDGMWPYSYDDVCDAGITPNQSAVDGISWLPGMRLPACTCAGEDHPTPGKSRSAPEIDVIEATNANLDDKGNIIGEVSQSYQVAPFDIWYQPNYDWTEIYDHSITHINEYRGGPYQQACSGLTNVNNNWYDGHAYQNYAYEYIMGDDGHVVWFVGDDATWRIHQNALGPNGNVGKRIIPKEPMSMIMNFGMSGSFSAVNFTGIGALLPAKMRVDYIRIYQDKNGNMDMTCDPPGYETSGYIRRHRDVYDNQNVTNWLAAGRTWPKNTLMNGCSA